MSYAAGGGTTTAAATVAAIAQAVKASGAIVRVEPRDFEAILSRVEEPLVVMTEKVGLSRIYRYLAARFPSLFRAEEKPEFCSKHYEYLTAYKGLVFFTKTPTPLELHPDVERIWANRIWVPN